MAFLKYAKATVQKPNIPFAEWDALRRKALLPDLDFQKRTAQVILQEYDPSKYMLSHATIVASVDVENAPAPLGKHFIDGFEIDRKYPDYYITPKTSHLINNNFDGFERKLLLATFKTFIGAQSFIEHVQIPELSKGRIIDAAARDVGDSIYVDILIANELKHAPLIRAIKNGQLGTLSMGCFVPSSQVIMADGSRLPIERVIVGDSVLTHKGRVQEVTNTQIRIGHFGAKRISVEGISSVITVTNNHPFFVLREKLLEIRADKLVEGDLIYFPEVDNYAPIISIQNVVYEGPVHNMEVEEDHSYTIEGVAVHNCSTSFTICSKCGNVALDESQLCNCVKYFKGNEFTDESGTKRRCGELCFPPGTRIWTSCGRGIPIEEIKVGESVLTHKGRSRVVTKTSERLYDGNLVTLNVVGFPFITLKSTPQHPYLVLSAKEECACGCGYRFKHRSYDKREYTRTYAPGHNPTGVAGSTKLPDFLFKEASNIKVGDILALPIPNEVRPSIDVNEDKALLLGWFLAEGSYLKYKGVSVGIDFTLNANDEGEVAKELASLLSENFVPECDGHKEFVPKVWLALNNPSSILDLATHMGCSTDLIKQVLRKHPEHFKAISGRGVRKDPVIWSRHGECPTFDKVPHIYYEPRAEGGLKLIVRYNNKKAVAWFYTHAGEYASSKKLSEAALFWPLALQQKILQGYVRGDGSVDAYCRHCVSTVSSVLATQTRLLAARCGFWTRQQITFEGKAAQLNKVVNGDSVVVGSDGWLPRFETHFHRSNEVNNFFEMATEGRERIPKWRKLDGYLLHRVKEVGTEIYQGLVYNISVEDDESYLVEGLAVHNCGHYTDKNSVKFLEASWVANPAFKGAVLRNILTAEEIKTVEDKMHMAFTLPLPTPISDSMSKAAYCKFAEEGESFCRSAQNDFPPDKNKSLSDQDSKKNDPIQKVVSELTDALRDQVIKKVRDEIGRIEVDAVRSADPNKQNESLIKSAMQCPEWRKVAKLVFSFIGKSQARRVLCGLILYKHGGWSSIKKAGFTGKEILAISRTLDLMTKKSSIAGETRVYRTVLDVGGTAPYEDVETYLAACRQVIGRMVTGNEAARLLEKGRLYALGRS